MTKRRDAGSCAEALWTFVESLGRQALGERASAEASRAEGVVRVAEVLGIGTHVLRNILNPDRPEQLSLERAGLLSRTSGLDGLARWLATEAGGTFIPLPAPSGDMERLTARGVRAAGEAAARVIEAQSDASEDGAAISEAEARDLARDCRQVVETFGEIAALADQIVRKSQRAARRAE